MIHFFFGQNTRPNSNYFLIKVKFRYLSIICIDLVKQNIGVVFFSRVEEYNKIKRNFDVFIQALLNLALKIT